MLRGIMGFSRADLEELSLAEIQGYKIGWITTVYTLMTVFAELVMTRLKEVEEKAETETKAGDEEEKRARFEGDFMKVAEIIGKAG